MIKNHLIIIGAGGLGREVAWLVERINHHSPTWNLLGFLDDNPALHGKTINGHPVLGGCETLAACPEAYAVCAGGAPKVRRNIIEKIKSISPTQKFATLLDPSVEKSSTVSIGEGTIICARSILTVDIHIGDHVIVNLDCKIGHDAVVGIGSVVVNDIPGDCVAVGCPARAVKFNA